MTTCVQAMGRVRANVAGVTDVRASDRGPAGAGQATVRALMAGARATGGDREGFRVRAGPMAAAARRATGCVRPGGRLAARGCLTARGGLATGCALLVAALVAGGGREGFRVGPRGRRSARGGLGVRGGLATGCPVATGCLLMTGGLVAGGREGCRVRPRGRLAARRVLATGGPVATGCLLVTGGLVAGGEREGFRVRMGASLAARGRLAGLGGRPGGVAAAGRVAAPRLARQRVAGAIGDRATVHVGGVLAPGWVGGRARLSVRLRARGDLAAGRRRMDAWARATRRVR